MATRTCNGDNCNAELTWNTEGGFYEDSLFPGEKHNHAKFNQAAGERTEASNEGTVEQKGRECYTCRDNGFPKVKIFFNAEKKSATGKMIPLASPNKVNGQWITHTHKTKQAGSQAQAPANDTPNYAQPATSNGEQALREYEAEFGKENPVPEGQDYSIEELKQLLGEFLNVAGELTAKLNHISPKVETAVGWIINQSVKPASQTK